jgi:hypothetical protein
MSNPYQPQTQTTEQSRQQEQQPGFFDSVPYHSWLAKNVKEPWNATDEDLTGKHFNDYIDGPIKTLVKGQIASQHGPGMNAGTLEAKSKAITDAIKLQKAGEVEQNLGKLRDHLNALKPAGAATSSTAGDPLEDAMLSAKKGAYNVGASAMLPLAGLSRSMISGNPGLQVAKMLGSKLPDKLQEIVEDHLFSLSQNWRAAAKVLPQGGTSVSSRVASFIGGLPSGIVSLFTGGDLTGALDAIDKNKSIAEGEKQVAKASVLNAAYAALGGLGKTIYTRAAFGGVGAGLLQEGERRYENAGLPENERIPFDPLNLALAVGAGAFGGAITKGKPSEVKGGGAVDEDALAAAAKAKQGDLTPEELNPSPFTAKPSVLSPRSGFTNDKGEYVPLKEPPSDAGGGGGGGAATTELSPEEQALYDELTKGEQNASPPQAKPVQAQPAPVQTETTKDQVPPSEAVSGEVPVEPPKQEFKLPPSISRAQPRYGLDKVGFESDLDKALYIVANPATRSRAHSMYVDWLKNDVGLNSKEIMDMAARVKAAVKDASRNNRNPVGSDTHFDLPEVEHPELAPKSVEAAKSPEVAPVEPPKPAQAAPEPPKGTVASMLGEPVKAPILGARGKQVGSTNLKFANDVDKLGYLYANADEDTQIAIAQELKTRGIRDPEAFAKQVQAQVRNKTKTGGGLRSVPADTEVGAIVPQIMQEIPLPPKGKPR